jgi:hypothetical protein
MYICTVDFLMYLHRRLTTPTGPTLIIYFYVGPTTVKMKILVIYRNLYYNKIKKINIV